MTAHLRMLDVSANNHPEGTPIDWERVRAAGFRAAMVKCSEGTSYINPWCATDGRGAHAAGLRIGYYHFAHPGQHSAGAEAVHALSAIEGLPRSMGLALDLEVTEGRTWAQLAAWARTWFAAGEGHVNGQAIYLNDTFLASLPDAPFGRRLWLAQTARPRRAVWAWQTTTPQDVDGISGPVDVGWLY